MGQVEHTLQGKKLFLLDFRRGFAKLRDIGCGGNGALVVKIDTDGGGNFRFSDLGRAASEVF